MMDNLDNKYCGKVSKEDVLKLVEWRERGRSHYWIAEQLGVSKSAVHYHCLKQGAISPNQKLAPVPTEPKTFIGYNGKPCRRFTVDDDNQLLALELAGKNYAEISRETGRARTSVRVRLMTLAQRDEITEMSQ